MISAEDLQPEFFCLAAPTDLPHIPAYPWEDSIHPAMITSRCAICGQEIYAARNQQHGAPAGAFALRLIIHEEDEAT